MGYVDGLILAVTGGLVTLAVQKIFKSIRIKTIRDDIEFIEFEKAHLEAMKRSSVEMNRSSFRGLFLVAMMIGIACYVPHFLLFIDLQLSDKESGFLGMILWAFVIAVTFKFWRRYDNLKNFKEATEKMDIRLDKLKLKLEKI